MEISASPSTIERGRQTTLTWKSTNASALLIDSGVGNVAGIGSVVVSPRESTTYTATAKGPGGEAKSSTRVTVVARTRDTVIRSTDIDSLQRAIDEGRVKPVFFDYDKAQLSAQAKHTLEQNARWLREFANAAVIIEGHCDERGTEEYNLALGDRRAQAAKDYLAQLGIDRERLQTLSFGEERPFAPGHDESAWRLNRRAHFVVKR
ncbi:MAG: peptidoglycan-associated lipoprotein Pal [Acidobacteriota bacterium]